MSKLKLVDYLSASIGVIAGMISGFLGGWTTGLQVLIICMVSDFITGIIVAILCKSKRTENGGLKSDVLFKGLCKKILTLLIVGLSYQLERVTGFAGIKDIVIIGYIVNEIVSILENAGLIGVPLPSILTKVLEVLQKKVDEVEPSDLEK